MADTIDWPEWMTKEERAEADANSAVIDAALKEFVGQIGSPAVTQKVRHRLLALAGEGTLSPSMAEHIRRHA